MYCDIVKKFKSTFILPMMIISTDICTENVTLNEGSVSAESKIV